MKLAKLFFISLIIGQSLQSQNLLENPDFENIKRNYLLEHGRNLHFGDTFYTIDSFTTNWKAVFGAPCYRNSKLPFRTVMQGASSFERHPKAFRNSGLAGFYIGYLTKDTSTTEPQYYQNPEPKYQGFNNLKFFTTYANSGIYQKLKNKLIKDSTYTVSYRLFSGNDLDIKWWGALNHMNIFGVHFSTIDLQDHYNSWERRQYEIKDIKMELQDTILDTTMRWRKIEVTFRADSAYEFINFAQFMDRKKHAKYYFKTDFTRIHGLKRHELQFPFFLDDIRLLPSYQYLKTSQDVDTCAGLPVTLHVLSGIGPYTWTDLRNPSVILSTTDSVVVTVSDSMVKYQVSSPYDTAIIAVYSKVKTDSILSPLTYTKCIGDSLVIENPEIERWNDQSTLKRRTLYHEGSYTYKTYYNSCRSKTHTITYKIDSLTIRLPQDTNLRSCETSLTIIPSIRSTSTIRSYLWDNLLNTSSRTVQKSGRYHLLVENTNCKASDTIVVEYLKKGTSYDSFTRYSCREYEWDGTKYQKSGIYTKTYKNRDDCDSNVTLLLSLGLNRSIKLENGTRYMALQDSVHYQWYQCNPWRRIANDTNQFFSTMTRGSYAVVLDDGKGCRDTSDCIALYSSGIVMPSDQWTQVYPNPFKNEISIMFGKVHQAIHIKIYDLTGREILHSNYTNTNACSLNLDHIAQGTYYLQIKMDTEFQFINLLKE